MINLLTRAGISSLQFQNQIVNDEDKSAGKVYGCSGGVLQRFERLQIIVRILCAAGIQACGC